MKTNGDGIREMSDEDLAVLLAELGACECCTCKGTDHDCLVKSCDEGICEWLQQEGGIRDGRLQTCQI